MEEKGKKSPIKNTVDKKISQVRKIYQCFCSKKYGSFPALYLHAKNIHEFNMTVSKLRVINSEWSGSIKNLYYEYDENYEQGIDQNMQSSEKEQKPIIPIKKSPQEPKRRQKKKNTTMLTNWEQNINQVLQRFAFSKSYAPHSKEVQLLQNFISFLNGNYTRVSEQTQTYENYCSESTCKYLPLHFNNFYLQNLHNGNPLRQADIDELNQLGKWLTINGYTQLITMQATQYHSYFPNQQ